MTRLVLLCLLMAGCNEQKEFNASHYILSSDLTPTPMHCAGLKGKELYWCKHPLTNNEIETALKTLCIKKEYTDGDDWAYGIYSVGDDGQARTDDDKYLNWGWWHNEDVNFAYTHEHLCYTSKDVDIDNLNMISEPKPCHEFYDFCASEFNSVI